MYVRPISGYFAVLARKCLTSTLDYIVMQMRKINREKGYFLYKNRLLGIMVETEYLF